METKKMTAGEVMEDVIEHIARNSGITSEEIENMILDFRRRFPAMRNTPANPNALRMAKEIKDDSDLEVMIMKIYAAGKEDSDPHN
jgi:predicted nucleic acid-binding protein